MSNFINFKKFTAKVLIGILITGSLVTTVETKETFASQSNNSCLEDANSGIGQEKKTDAANKVYRYATLSNGEAIKVAGLDLGNKSKIDQLGTTLAAGGIGVQGGIQIAYSNNETAKSLLSNSQELKQAVENLSYKTTGSLVSDLDEVILIDKTRSFKKNVTISCLTSEYNENNPFNLKLNNWGNTSGLEITYTCIDDRGCNNVKKGDNRDFRVDIKGVTVGQYNFDTFADRLYGAVTNDKIRVIEIAD